MRTLLTFTVIVFAAFANLSCKCGWGGNFLRVGPHQDLVVKARVLGLYKVHSDIYEKMEVEVIKTFKGTEKRKRIVVWGDDGKSCRPYLSQFKKGEVCYLALNTEEKDYEISVCGQYFLHIQNNQVQLERNEEDSTALKPMDLAGFEKALAEQIK